MPSHAMYSVHNNLPLAEEAIRFKSRHQSQIINHFLCLNKCFDKIGLELNDIGKIKRGPLTKSENLRLIAHTIRKCKKMAGQNKFQSFLLNDANMIGEH